MAERICPRCGTEFVDSSRFCNQCGAKLVNAPEISIKATQRAITSSMINYRLGLVYYKKGKLNEAIAAWEKVLKVEPDNIEVRQDIEKARREREELTKE